MPTCPRPSRPGCNGQCRRPGTTGRSNKRCFRTAPRPPRGANTPSRIGQRPTRIWQEERESNPLGYGCSRFCDLYRCWLKKLDLVLRQEHRAGEKMFVDYAGDTIAVYDPRTGDVQEAAVFVADLGASSYAFAEATSGQDLPN